MAKQVILAVAGAGKTYHICHNIDVSKKNLILAYTHENIKNIRRELIEAFGCIPKSTTVLTFDSFVYRYMVLPYEPSILQFFQKENFRTKGITINKPAPQTINGKPNPKYFSKDKIEHYITSKGFYYCENLAELIMYIKHNRSSLIKRIASNLNNFYNEILIDEFQDFREYDYDLITSMAKEIDNITLVGDYNQHSVSAVNNSGRPFKKRTLEINYDDFKTTITNMGFTIDENTLQASRRCPENICNFVREKLNISFTHNNDHSGDVIFIDNNIDRILEDNNIIKLVHKNYDKYKFRAMNWSYSKGDTFDNVCVILTDNFEKLSNHDFTTTNISQITLNQLYVALTRTKGSLYLIKNSDFKKVKSKYRK